ncbi:jg14956 [Pararge aegeria aegeria]|uniref:Jg14956 protein n=1 Tax=Pararge aegeria aegeria TaxID=348720 RepID=A0A8S4SMY1_9NEOP|nr:jg14956 [Pararge aegeria aegeria]
MNCLNVACGRNELVGSRRHLRRVVAADQNTVVTTSPLAMVVVRGDLVVARISVIFQVRSAKAVKISDMYLLRRIGVIVGVACVLLSIRTLVAPPTVIVGRTTDDLKAYLCNTDWWDHSFTTCTEEFLTKRCHEPSRTLPIRVGFGVSPPSQNWTYKTGSATLACNEHVLQHAALFGCGHQFNQPHVTVIKPATTPFRPQHSIAIMLLSGRNKQVEVIFLMWGIRLCIMVRKAPSEFNESRFISMAIYNEFLLSVFLNISMLFLQSPANPDLLYIIFFCHTQLTVTLLLCFIFGSRAYMVFKGQGKDEREKTKFRSRPADSTYTMTTNRSAHFCDNMTERDLEEEFKKICNQLEKLRERCGPGAHLSKIISAMKDAATLHERSQGTTDSAPLKLNTVFSAVAGKLMCTVTPGEESSSSGRDLPFEAPPAYKQRNFTLAKSTENSNAEQSQTDVTTDSPKKRTDLNEDIDSKEDKQNGVFKISGEAAGCSDIRPPEVAIKNGIGKSDRSEVRSSPSSTETVKGVRSGHARTHAIVINLDDKSRFTEEVTV